MSLQVTADWADKKAEALCGREWCGTGCGNCRATAAALREAREQGAREERRKCYELVRGAILDFTDERYVAGMRRCMVDIAARGPMSQEGGGE